MPKNSKQYQHPVLGEVWLAPGSMAFVLHQEKKFDQLNTHLQPLFKKPS